MQRSVVATIAFLEGPLVLGSRVMAIDVAADCLREAQRSRVIPAIGVAPAALLSHAIQLEHVDTVDTDCRSSPMPEHSFKSVEQWATVSAPKSVKSVD